MQGLGNKSEKIFGWRDPVGKSADWYTSSLDFLPVSYEAYPKAASEAFVEYLREEVQITHKCWLKDDWNVGSIEEFHCKGSGHSPILFMNKFDLYSKSLQIYDEEENEDGGQ